MEMELHTENLEEDEDGRLPCGRGGRTVRSSLSLLRPNEALTPDPVTLQSVRLVATLLTRQGLAGFGNICRFQLFVYDNKSSFSVKLIPWVKTVFDISFCRSLPDPFPDLVTRLSFHRETFKTSSRTKKNELGNFGFFVSSN